MREEDQVNTLKEQFWKSLRRERLKHETRVKFETIESFELLRRAVRAEENETKIATNLQQQHLKQLKKEADPKEDKLDLIVKRIEALERGRNKGGWNANQSINRQKNKQPYYVKNKNTKYDKKEKAPKIVRKYDQEVPQSQTADNPVAPRGRAAQPSRDTRKTN